ncbi:SRPBCC family protein [Actinomycetota bacterium]
MTSTQMRPTPADELPPGAWAVVRRTVPVPPESAWARLTTLSAHEAGAPFTTMQGEPTLGPGSRFSAVTRLGPVRLDDPMAVTRWSPPEAGRPGELVIDKTGRVLHGRAHITVRAAAGGTEVQWREAIWPARQVPAWLRPLVALVSRLGSRWLFARVLDGAFEGARTDLGGSR